MISDKQLPRLDPDFHFDTKVRERRLMDVKRGQQYLRKIDSLAEAQWMSNEPRFGRRANLIAARPTTDSPFTKARYMYDNDIDSLILTNRNRVQSEKLNTFRNEFTHDDYKKESKNFNLSSRQTKIGKMDYLDIFQDLKKRKLETVRRDPYNPYGSRYTQLDQKTELGLKDLEPRFEPFRFRESIPRVVKPVPKTYAPMSRAMPEEKDRPLKYQTNFRSTRNGVVNVIRPLKPDPDTSGNSFLQPFESSRNVQNEKTFVLMKRLNKFLQQERSDSLESSEREFPPSRSPSISDASEHASNYHRQRKAFKRARRTVSPDKDQVHSKPVYPMYHKITYQSKGKSKISFEDSLAGLNKIPMDVQKKCCIWVNTCIQKPP